MAHANSVCRDKTAADQASRRLRATVGLGRANREAMR
jgi:hypothetical protein